MIGLNKTDYSAILHSARDGSPVMGRAMENMMPKEMIYGSNLPYTDDSPARAVVELNWGRETNHVQLASLCIDASTHEIHIPKHVQDQLVNAGLAHTQMLTTADDAKPIIWTCFDGFYVDLDRRGINDLIRNLRRARDQAFGRDE